MRAFLALAARWERVERWNILGGGLVWFGEIGNRRGCDTHRKSESERFGLLIGGGLDKDLFDELLIPISTQRAFLYIYIYIKKSQFPLLPYLPVSSSSSNEQQKSASS